MKSQDEIMLAKQSPSKNAEEDSRSDRTRAEERGEADEPDAPLAAKENAGMSSILDEGPGAGVQEDDDAGDNE